MTALLKNNGIDEVSASACEHGEGGSDFVSFATESYHGLSVEDIFTSLAADSIAMRHTWGGGLRIFSTNQMVRFLSRRQEVIGMVLKMSCVFSCSHRMRLSLMMMLPTAVLTG